MDCVVTKTFAITEIAPTQSFPQPVPKNGGEKPVEYPADPQPLIDASDFCYQEVWYVAVAVVVLDSRGPLSVSLSLSVC